MDLWGFVLLAVVVYVGMWLGAKLTLVGLLCLGAALFLLHAIWWWRGYFKQGLASIPPLIVIVLLWLGWGVAIMSATPEYWSQWSPQLRPIASIFVKL